ncbi:MAG: trigger factor [Nitrospinota bacterium]|nr:trigger factor [Nitrospinota bacterium]
MSDIKVEDASPTLKRLTIVVPDEVISEAKKEACRKLSRTVKLPGFRPGKIPQGVMERNFPEKIGSSLINDVVPKEITKAIKAKGLKATGTPTLEDVTMEEGKPFSFVATTEVFPEITLAKYEGSEFKKEIIKVTDEDVDSVLNNMRDQKASLECADDKVLEEGNCAIFDVVGAIDGQEIPTSKQVNQQMIIGDKMFLPEIEAGIIGLKKGDTKEISVDIPKEPAGKELVGKQVVYTIAIKEVKLKILPELNDEFAKEFENDTMDALKKDIREKLEDNQSEEATAKLKEDVINKLIEDNKFDIPDSIVKFEEENLSRMIQEQYQLMSRGRGKIEQTPEQKEEIRKQAAKVGKRKLILKNIAEKENISVTGEELEEEIKGMAERQKVSMSEMKKRIKEYDALETIKYHLSDVKAYDSILGKIKIKDVFVEAKKQEEGAVK